jgi:hypothetical protein
MEGLFMGRLGIFKHCPREKQSCTVEKNRFSIIFSIKQKTEHFQNRTKADSINING